MSVNSKALNDPAVRKTVTEYYTSDIQPNIKDTAKAVHQTVHTVSAILRSTLSQEVLTSRKRANYSKSKMGQKNPMHGLRFDRINLGSGCPRKWVGDGYLLESRRVMGASMGAPIPSHLHVHHIDNDPMNNHIDNLCVVNASGHTKLHLQKLRKLYVWEKETFGTSKLKKIIAM